MGTDSLYARNVRLLRARATARRDHWASLDPVDLVPWTFHPGSGSNDCFCGAQPHGRGADRHPPLGTANHRVARWGCRRAGALAVVDYVADAVVGLADG